MNSYPIPATDKKHKYHERPLQFAKTVSTGDQITYFCPNGIIITATVYKTHWASTFTDEDGITIPIEPQEYGYLKIDVLKQVNSRFAEMLYSDYLQSEPLPINRADTQNQNLSKTAHMLYWQAVFALQEKGLLPRKR